MMHRGLGVWFAIFLGFAEPSTAEPLGGIVSEVRAGALMHDVGFLGDSKERGSDINGEILFLPLGFGSEDDGLVANLLNPRPHLGVQINSTGATSQIYAGLSWRFFPIADLWLGLGAGGMVHNGKLNNRRDQRDKALGSRVLFRLSAELGYDVTDNLSVSIYYDHESNAGLADDNEGLNNAGGRVGWRF